MGDAQKVQISDGFTFEFWAGFGALGAIGWTFLVGGGIYWVENKLSSHKAHYVISVQPRQGDTSDEMYVTEDYSRKLSGQIVSWTAVQPDRSHSVLAVIRLKSPRSPTNGATARKRLQWSRGISG